MQVFCPFDAVDLGDGRRKRRCGRGHVAAHPTWQQPEPPFEAEDRPKPLSGISVTGQVPLHQPMYGVCLEVRAVSRAWIQEMVAQIQVV